MHKHESLVPSGEVDIFWHLLMFPSLPQQSWGCKTAAGKEQEKGSRYRLPYCISNPAWVKFLWFRGNFILGRKQPHVFRKTSALIFYMARIQKRWNLRDLASQAWGSSQKKLGVGQDTVHPPPAEWPGRQLPLAPLLVKACHVGAGSTYPSTSCFNYREVSRPCHFVISHVCAVRPVVAFPLCKYKARRQGLSFRSRGESENKHTSGSSCSAQEKWNLSILVYWWFTPGYLPKKNLTYNKKRIYIKAIEIVIK